MGELLAYLYCPLCIVSIKNPAHVAKKVEDSEEVNMKKVRFVLLVLENVGSFAI